MGHIAIHLLILATFISHEIISLTVYYRNQFVDPYLIQFGQCQEEIG